MGGGGRACFYAGVRRGGGVAGVKIILDIGKCFSGFANPENEMKFEMCWSLEQSVTHIGLFIRIADRRMEGWRDAGNKGGDHGTRVFSDAITY
jgi:hypothetical protein